MLSLRKPSADALRRFLAAQELPFTYEAVGATAETPPAGYVVDRTRIKLGEGEQVFRSAIAALRRWEQFRLGWVEAWPPDTPIRPRRGRGGDGPGHRRLVAQRLPGRVRRGRGGAVPRSSGSPTARCPATSRAARSGSWSSGTGATTPCGIDILAFSRPNHVLARLGYPVVRRLQRRFGRDSAAAMLRAVRSGDGIRAGQG